MTEGVWWQKVSDERRCLMKEGVWWKKLWMYLNLGSTLNKLKWGKRSSINKFKFIYSILDLKCIRVFVCNFVHTTTIHVYNGKTLSILRHWLMTNLLLFPLSVLEIKDLKKCTRKAIYWIGNLPYLKLSHRTMTCHHGKNQKKKFQERRDKVSWLEKLSFPHIHPFPHIVLQY